MKICFLSFEFPPFILGGAGVYAKHLTEEVAKLGHEVHVISSCTTGSSSSTIENGVFVHRIPILNNPFLSAPSYWLKLTSYFKILNRDFNGFDLLHTNAVSDLSIAKLFVSVPRVVTVHHLLRDTIKALNPSLIQRLLNPRGEVGMTHLIQKKVIDRADHIIADSNFTKRSLTSIYGIPCSKITVINIGIDVGDYECPTKDVLELKHKLGLIDKHVVLFVGRLDKRKGLATLLRAFRLLPEKSLAKLIVVGHGDQTPLKTLANSLGVSKDIIFTGYIDDTTKKRLYKACDIFVSPSLLEGFGITLLEAMAAGKPVVASNKGSIPEVVRDGENGILVDPLNAEELADAMVFFLKNNGLAEEIGEKNRRYVASNFKWSRSAKLTEQVYRNLSGPSP